MTEINENPRLTEESNNVDSTVPVMSAGDDSPVKSAKFNLALESSDDESAVPVFKTKKRVTKFSDSDSDMHEGTGSSEGTSKPEVSARESTVIKTGLSKSRIRKVSLSVDDDSAEETNLTSKTSEADTSGSDEELTTIFKKGVKKSRIRKVVGDNEDSDSQESLLANKNEEQQLRMKNKKNKMKDKFKSLLNSREKGSDSQKKDNENEFGKEKSNSDDSEDSNDESSINNIRQKIKERSALLKMSICDPDTSDDEEKEINTMKSTNKPKKQQKRTKMISPKPQRMSAKEAMENMQKIKSESNRMLREREVSLPYHRPKALSLQDIMKRRRPAVSSDGKALPIKMNEEQLKQYALSLEQRQKEMMELCKSESEEEDGENNDLNNAEITNNIEKEAEIENVSDTAELINISTTDKTCEINNVIEKESEPKEPIDADSQIAINKEIISETDALVAVNTVNDYDSNKLEKDCNNQSEDMSAEMELVYNDSAEDTSALNDISRTNIKDCETNSKIDEDMDSPVTSDENRKSAENDGLKDCETANLTTNNTEVESQLISLHFDSEMSEQIEVSTIIKENMPAEDKESSKQMKTNEDDSIETSDFPDDDMDMDDINMEEIDSIIENTQINKDSTIGTTDSPALVREIPVLNVKPKLTGAPGMVIDLDGTDPIAPKKLTGVELLKERFIFFAKLKTPEEMEKAREKRQKPGTQHLKLKQELENIIAEQRSLEWSKRLEGEKLQQKEEDAIRGDDSEDEDDIDKIEAKLAEKEIDKDSPSESENEDDLLEDDVLIEDKPKKKSNLVDDEAEESDVNETEENDEKDIDENIDDGLNDNGIQGNDDTSGEDSSEDEESSESEDESEAKPKKGRILKAFEDSDDEEVSSKLNDKELTAVNNETDDAGKSDNIAENKLSQSQSYGIIDSQDDVIQLAQVPKQMSSDVFTSQGTANNSHGNGTNINNSKDDEDLGTQTFSIMNSSKMVKDIDDPDKLTVVVDDEKLNVSGDLDKFTVISETQPFSDDNLDAVVGMCSGSFQTQNCIEIQPPSIQTQMSQSQAIGEDLLDMCTGKFYDNEFVSPSEDNVNATHDLSQDETAIDQPEESAPTTEIKNNEKQKQEDDTLKSVLEELNEPDFETAKPLKFFFDSKTQNKENEPNEYNTQFKKRFVIESDDETNDNTNISKQRKKKFKKKKLEKRALQISDDEEEFEDGYDDEGDFLSENEGNADNDEEDRLIEYDSEENEVEIKPQSIKKKKRKATEFFEQEAELTSEDEWAGSGDEDEAGLDRMEREDGDDDRFHQGQLQRELGQIHMRDVLDQDKREVRLIQELLFEDGDLGGGGRQRKFRWRNADGEEVTGTVPEEFADTQEDEFESEEQWRKQRHEREMFLRQMKTDEKEDELNVSVNRTTIIKANLNSRTMSSLLDEVNKSNAEAPKPPPTAVPEKKTAKDIPSPAKKPFTMFQQNYHGSLLTRGQGALARLAALATPLAADGDAPRPALRAPTSKTNFVFAAISKEETEPKVTKRKAETNVGTPRLVKKMKTEEKQNRHKSSLLEFLKT